MKQPNFLIFLLIFIYLFSWSGIPHADANSNGQEFYDAPQIQEQMDALLKQLIALLQDYIKLQMAMIDSLKNQVFSQPNPPQPAEDYQIPPAASYGQEGPKLVVNASGISPYVSINGGSSFLYSEPISLKEGDSYLVFYEAKTSSSSIINRCSGTVSSSGTYVCNILVKP